MDADPRILARQIRQRLEGLSRAGLDRIAIGPLPTFKERPADDGATGPLRRPMSAATPAAPVADRIAAVPSGPPAAAPAAEPESTTPPPAPPRRPARPAAAPAAAAGPAIVGSLFEEPGIAEPAVPPEQRAEALRAIAEEVAGCTRCAVLAASRTNTVPGEGSPTARLMFVGEGPGQTEDETGRPFVGRAGQLLDDMITKGMGLRREDVFIANIVKCRPPGNRDPEPDEVRSCIGYLERQIAIVRPEFLCILGKPASQALLNTSMPMGRLRGKWQRYRGIPTIATWHPAYLLRNPSAKKETWEDLQMLMNAMGIPLPRRSR